MNDKRYPRLPQFRLRTLFILTTVVAIVLSGTVGRSPEVQGLTAGLALLFLTANWLMLAICSRGALRAFAIGAATPALATNYTARLFHLGVASLPEAMRVHTWLTLNVAAMLICGFAAMLIYIGIGVPEQGGADDDRRE